MRRLQFRGQSCGVNGSGAQSETWRICSIPPKSYWPVLYRLSIAGLKKMFSAVFILAGFQRLNRFKLLCHRWAKSAQHSEERLLPIVPHFHCQMSDRMGRYKRRSFDLTRKIYSLVCCEHKQTRDSTPEQ